MITNGIILYLKGNTESKSCEMPVKEFSPQDVILNINGVKCVDYLIQD